MFDNVFQTVQYGAAAAWNWLDDVFDGIPGAWAFVAAVIIVFIIVQRILAPVTGQIIHAGISDQVSGRAEARAKRDSNDWVKMEKRRNG